MNPEPQLKKTKTCMTVYYQIDAFGCVKEAETTSLDIHGFTREQKISFDLVYIGYEKIEPMDPIPEDTRSCPLNFITSKMHLLHIYVDKQQRSSEFDEGSQSIGYVLHKREYSLQNKFISNGKNIIPDVSLPIVLFRVLHLYTQIDIQYHVDNTAGTDITKRKFPRPDKAYAKGSFPLKPDSTFKDLAMLALQISEGIVVEVSGRSYDDLNQTILEVVPFQKILKCTFEIRSNYPATVDVLQKIMYPPSTFACNNSILFRAAGKKMSPHELRKYHLDFHGLTIYDHRPIGFDSITLYYGAFSNITEESMNVAIDKDDCKLTLDLCTEMMKYYEDEDGRRVAFNEWAEHLFNSKTEVQLMTGCKSSCDMYFTHSAIVEVKNERGQTGSECLMECISYYTQFIKANPSRSPHPLLLLCLDGVTLYVYGAVFMQNIIVDPLMPPLELLPVMRQSDHMIRITRGLKALKNGCRQLYEFYSTGTRSCSSGLRVWPEFCKYVEGGECHTLDYEECLCEHVYKCKLNFPNSSPKSVIVKFTSTWCENANRILANEGFAPELFHVGKQGSYKAVVMEFIDGVMLDMYMENFPSSKDTLKGKCQRALSLLHTNGYVHGDFRSQNIMVFNEGEIKVIDFDWAGFADTATYPYFMNHTHISWPSDAADGMLITKRHDLYWLKKMFEVEA